MLDLDRVSVGYRQNQGLFKRSTVVAVRAVSLAVAPGETLALVGESGSGKTTLGKAILRLLEPFEGNIALDGENVADLAAGDRRFRRRVQAIFQDPYSSISPYMTVRDIVAEPLVIHRIPDRESRIGQALERVHLNPDEVLAKHPHALSGGQRQRVSIARALVLEPEYIVADEPVSMVDASNRMEILGLLKEIQNQTKTAFLYITHDLASAREFAHRIAVMYAGSIVEQGTISEVLDHPLHPYTRALLAAVPSVDARNAGRLRPAIEGEPPSGAALPAGCAFHPRCPVAIRGRCEITVPALESKRGAAQSHFTACHLHDQA